MPTPLGPVDQKACFCNRKPQKASEDTIVLKFTSCHVTSQPVPVHIRGSVQRSGTDNAGFELCIDEINRARFAHTNHGLLHIKAQLFGAIRVSSDIEAERTPEEAVMKTPEPPLLFRTPDGVRCGPRVRLCSFKKGMPVTPKA
jgi:hypothetical protein